MLTMHWVMKPFVSPQCFIFCLISAAWKGKKAMTIKWAAMSLNAASLAAFSLYRVLAHDIHSFFTSRSTCFRACYSEGQWVAPNVVRRGPYFDNLRVSGYNPWEVKHPSLLYFSDSTPAKHSYETVKRVDVVWERKKHLWFDNSQRDPS